MPEPLQYLQAMIATAGVSAVGVLTLAMPWARERTSTARWKLAAIAGVAIGSVLGAWLLQQPLRWPPAGALDRFWMIVFPAVLLVEAATAWQRMPPRWIWPLRLVLASAIGSLLLHGSVYVSGPEREWTTPQAAATLLIAAGLLAAVWALLARLVERPASAAVPLSLAQAIQTAGIAIMLYGYLAGGAAAIPLAASLVAVPLVAGSQASKQNAQAVVGIGVVSLFSLLFVGTFFGRLPLGSAIALFLAPLLAWASEIPKLQPRQPWQIAALRLALVAIPLIIVLLLAKQSFDERIAPLLSRNEPPGLSRRKETQEDERTSRQYGDQFFFRDSSITSSGINPEAPWRVALLSLTRPSDCSDTFANPAWPCLPPPSPRSASCGAFPVRFLPPPVS